MQIENVTLKLNDDDDTKTNYKSKFNNNKKTK